MTILNILKNLSVFFINNWLWWRRRFAQELSGWISHTSLLPAINNHFPRLIDSFNIKPLRELSAPAKRNGPGEGREKTKQSNHYSGIAFGQFKEDLALYWQSSCRPRAGGLCGSIWPVVSPDVSHACLVFKVHFWAYQEALKAENCSWSHSASVNSTPFSSSGPIQIKP